MNKRMILAGLFIIGVFCAIAPACSCPPVPPCYYLTSGWPTCNIAWSCSSGQTCCNGSCCSSAECKSCVDGSCESTCNPDLCKSCDGHGNCITCNNDPNQKCCPAIPGLMQASCALPCQTEYGEDCSGTPSFCGGCALNGDCSWQGNSKIYTGGSEKICNPRGCPSDCHDDTKVCYTEYPCIPFPVGMPLSSCVNVCMDPGGYTWPCPPHCEVAVPPFKCYSCMGDDDNPLEHYVENDSCNY